MTDVYRTDVHADLTSGDPAKQSVALTTLSSMLASDRDVARHVAVACQLLGSSNLTPATRKFAYDFILAAGPTDADWGRVAAAITADVQQGGHPDVRPKALSVLAILNSSYASALLLKPEFMERFISAIRHPNARICSAAISALAQLSSKDAILASVAASEQATEGLQDAWVGVCEALVDDDDSTVAAACKAIGLLLEKADFSSPIKQVSGDNALNNVNQVKLGAISDPSAAMIDVQQDEDDEDTLAKEMVNAGVELRRILAVDIVQRVAAQFSVVLSRLRRVGTSYSMHTAPLLVAYLRALQPQEQTRPLDALPGDPGPAGAARAHAFDESTSYLAELLTCIDPATVVAAATGLFQIAQMDNASAANLQALLPSAINALVSLANASDTHRKIVAESTVLKLLLSNMSSLPSVQRALLLKQLPPIIAAAPSGADRTAAFVKMWLAALEHDWQSTPKSAAANSSARGGLAAQQQQPVVSEVQTLLAQSSIKSMLAGSKPVDTSGQTHAGMSVLDNLPHQRYAAPVFREELVGGLLYALLHHSKAQLYLSDGVTAASSAISEASQLHKMTEVVDWVTSSLQSLQGTKACLGWDRMAGLSTTGTTAVVDLWLQLLLMSIQLVHRSKAEMAVSVKAAVEEANARQQHYGLPNQQQQQPVQHSTKTKTITELYSKANETDVALQGLLLQIITNWRALHPVIRSRAVWICVFHLKFKSVVDSAWNGAVDAVHGLLAESSVVQQGGADAVAQGKLTSSGDIESSKAGQHHRAGIAAAANEQFEVALLCLERLAFTVAYNHKGKLTGHLAPIAGLLNRLVTLQLEKDNSPAFAERLEKLNKRLLPVATASKEPKSTKKSSKKGGNNNEDNSNQPEAPIIVDLLPDPTGPSTAAYPLAQPTSTALSLTAQAKRYREFSRQLVTAFDAASGNNNTMTADSSQRRDNGGGGLNGTSTSNGTGSNSIAKQSNIAGLPDFSKLASILSGGDAVFTKHMDKNYLEVTGSITPITLAFDHSLDPGTQQLTLHCHARNQTTEPMSALVVELIPGGPIASSRRPIVHRLDALSAHEGRTWDVEFPVNGFGWPTVQANIILPAEVPVGVASLRCKPYNISPLKLLTTASLHISPAEFYQRWQALPNTVHVAAAPTEQGDQGLLRLLSNIETAGLARVFMVADITTGTINAGYHGTAWTGETVACIVIASMISGGEKEGSGFTEGLHLHFGSESAEVVAHIKGREEELLSQLTGGLAIPVAGAGPSAIPLSVSKNAAAASEPESMPVSTFSFFKSWAQSPQAGDGSDDDDGADAKLAEEEAARMAEVLEGVCLDQWQRMRALASSSS